MSFWKLAFDYGWVTAEQLKGAVKTVSNPYGEISELEYRQITGVEYAA